MRLWRPGLLRFRRYGGKGSKDSPKKKRRPSGYILFTSAERQKMQGTHWATESQKEIMKELASRWRDEPQATKDEWNRRAKELPSPRVASPPKSKPAAQSKSKKAVSKKAKGKKMKPSGSPKKKRKPSGYILFTSAERQKMQGTKWATEPQKEIMKELASRWRDAPQATKDEWNERAKQVSSPAVALIMPASCTDHPHKKLQVYQKRVAKALMRPDTPGLLALHKTGTGKSLIAASATTCLLMSHTIKRAFVITRKSVVAQVRAEIAEMLKFHNVSPSKVFVGTHNSVMNEIGVGHASPSSGRVSSRLLIVDEAHLYSKQSKAQKELVRMRASCAKALLMTATPLTTDRNDLVNMLRIAKETLGGKVVDSDGRYAQIEIAEVEKKAKMLKKADDVRDGAKCNRATAAFTLPNSNPDTKARDTSHLSPANAALLKSLPKIPPAYVDVFVCPPPSRLLWHGTDSKGRGQGRYDISFQQMQMRKRDERVLKLLGPDFISKLNASAMRDASAGSQAAMVCLLLIECSLRLMHSADSKNFGLSTLLAKHVKGNTLKFIGKSNKGNECTLSDKVGTLLQSFVKAAKGGAIFPDVNAKHVNDYLGKEAYNAGALEKVTAKDFRTYTGNRAFVQALKAEALTLSALTLSERQRVIGEAVKAAAKSLNNTPAVARNSYISQPILLMAETCPVATDAALQSAQAPGDAVNAIAKYIGDNPKLSTALHHIAIDSNTNKAAGEDVSDAQLLALARGAVSIYYPGHTRVRVDTKIIKLKRKDDSPVIPGHDAFLAKARLLTANAPEKIKWLTRSAKAWRARGETPFLVYAERKNTVKLVADALKKVHISSTTIDGSSSEDMRQEKARAVSEGKYDALIISEAGAEGIDTKGLRHIVFQCLPWTWSRFEQVVGRGPRYSSHSHLPKEKRMVVVNVPLLGSTDKHVYQELLSRKKEQEHIVALLEGAQLLGRD